MNINLGIETRLGKICTIKTYNKNHYNNKKHSNNNENIYINKFNFNITKNINNKLEKIKLETNFQYDNKNLSDKHYVLIPDTDFVIPPSTRIFCPVIYAPPSDANISITEEISLTFP